MLINCDAPLINACRLTKYASNNFADLWKDAAVIFDFLSSAVCWSGAPIHYVRPRPVLSSAFVVRPQSASSVRPSVQQMDGAITSPRASRLREMCQVELHWIRTSILESFNYYKIEQHTTFNFQK